jgi:DNA mismatch repair protein MLH1
VENSIDAGSTQISVTLHQGGLKLIKIADNGNGILAEDFPLLCVRFATSKIREFGDLKMLDSFGFRGEALASLSYVSNLVVASKREDDKIGHSATFKKEEIVGSI